MRNNSIQGLRAVFILGVVLSHCTFLRNDPASAGIFRRYFSCWADVSFFFMLSGYFIAGSSRLPARLRDGFGFLYRRIRKYYPLHFLLLLSVIVPVALKGNFFKSYDGTSLLVNFFLLQAWVPGDAVRAINPVAWFLSALLFCHAAAFLLLYVGNRCGGKVERRILIAAAALLFAGKVAAAFIFRPEGLFDRGYYWIYFFPPAGLGDFLVGFLLGSISLPEHWKNPVVFQCTALVLLAGMALSVGFVPLYVRALWVVPLNVVLIEAFRNETVFSSRLLGNRILVFLGDISFEIYLSHVLVILMLYAKVPFFRRIAEGASPFAALLILIGIDIFVSWVYRRLSTLFCTLISKKRVLQ